MDSYAAAAREGMKERPKSSGVVGRRDSPGREGSSERKKRINQWAKGLMETGRFHNDGYFYCDVDVPVKLT